MAKHTGLLVGCASGLCRSPCVFWRTADGRCRSQQHQRGLFLDDGALKLKYCIFDWDDNVVHMPTKIWMQDASGTPLPLSTAEFARRRGEAGLGLLRGDAKEAFREFGDTHGDFKGDLEVALKGHGWQGPAFGTFKQAVLQGQLFAIVTARGQCEATLRKGVEHLINAMLSGEERQTMICSLRDRGIVAQEEVSDDAALQRFLSLCHFVGVTSPEFLKSVGRPISSEEGKKLAIRTFVQHILDKYGTAVAGDSRHTRISFGMSDDDAGNVHAIEAFMRDELSVAYPRVKFVMFDTGGGRILRHRSHCIEA